MEINNTMDIAGAKLQIKAMRDAKMLEVQALDVCLATLEQTFAPQFSELAQVKEENQNLKMENDELKTTNSSLSKGALIDAASEAEPTP